MYSKRFLNELKLRVIEEAAMDVLYPRSTSDNLFLLEDVAYSSEFSEDTLTEGMFGDILGKVKQILTGAISQVANAKNTILQYLKNPKALLAKIEQAKAQYGRKNESYELDYLTQCIIFMEDEDKTIVKPAWKAKENGEETKDINLHGKTVPVTMSTYEKIKDKIREYAHPIDSKTGERRSVLSQIGGGISITARVFNSILNFLISPFMKRFEIDDDDDTIGKSITKGIASTVFKILVILSALPALALLSAGATGSALTILSMQAGILVTVGTSGNHIINTRSQKVGIKR